MSTFRRTLAVAAAASAIVASGGAAALAQPATTAPTVSIGATALKVYGYNFVAFKDGKYASVTLSGTVTGGTSGMVAQLYAQQFPYKKAAAPVSHRQLVLDGTSSENYSFTATPGLATRYSVEILPSATASTPVQATSPTANVYVATSQYYTGIRKCKRPVCTETIKIYTIVPSSARLAEARKTLYFYFGIRFSATGKPAPTWLTLDRSAKIGKAKKVSGTEFEQTVSFSFRIGNNGYHFGLSYCSKASEPKDGVNLPGHHYCGNKKVRPSWFLG
jgi:hypothetical protein